MTPVLEVDGLSRSFGGLKVTRSVSLALRPGDRVALIGPNGAGKTTFVNLVTGHLKPDAGTVRMAGESLDRMSPMQRVRRGLVRSFQVTRLFPEMTPREHLALAAMQRRGRAGRLGGTFWSMPDVLAETGRLLAMLGLEEIADRPVSEIAYGQQRLLEIALALALRPRVLLLDEPGAGLPEAETSRIDAALANLPAELAVLMIDHDMDLVFRFASRVVVLASGAVIFDGTPAEVVKDPRVREAYLGSYGDDGVIP